MAQSKKSYSFKSVGQLQSTVESQLEQNVVNTPVGILTPVSFNQTGGSLFDMSLAIGDQIQDNFRNLLSTNHGERLLLTDYGANLKELAYDLTSENIIDEALIRISTAVSKYMPFVSLDTFEPSVVKNKDNSSIINKIKVRYSVPAAGITNQAVEVSIVVTS